MRRFWLVLVLLVAIGAAISATLLASRGEVPAVDTTDINHLAQSAAEQWPEPTSLPQTSASYTVTDLTGTVQAAQGEPITSALQAADRRAFTVPVVVDGAVVGYLYYVDPAVQAWADRDRTMTTRTVTAVLAATAVAALAWLYLWLRVVRPFRRLERFATDVAAGDLSAALPMDRDNAFGAFSESFDLMRTELEIARAGEAQAKASKQRLVAQIGHDIRTPVASIAATAELLGATVADRAAAGRIDTVLAKANQIDQLLGDLFQANRTELAALAVTPTEMASAELPVLLRRADFDDRAEIADPPECLVSVDPLRLQQVLDNVIVNSYKYAGTPITVSWSFGDGFLVAHVQDTGPGVPPDELTAIFGPGVRGTNAGDTPGSGLGLYTSAHLMERMGGALSARTVPGGFVVDVEIRLAS